jgi:hypothetical protein
MSQYIGNLSGTKPVIKTYRVGEAMTTAGVPIIGATANESGVMLGATTTSADAVGMTLDTVATYNTAQQTGNVDPAAYVKVVVNPDAMWQCRLSGTAASGGAIVSYFNTAASTTGLIVTPSLTSGGAAVDTSAKDDQLIVGYSGANAGIVRRAEPADATNCDVTQAFPFDIAVDDLFYFVGITEGAVQYSTLTTTLDEFNNAVATALNTTPTWRAVDMYLNDIGNNGLLNSYVNLICADHAYAGSALA